ncbi:nucleoporin autopeptidase [Nitzschia inconspicua]|uniref:Nucleoporin autopeptidase n=1 Tax=Nitzschia inconspicua TaxID=303405 RepID=A0A9K3L426_9STRA|nr:nucleoporin autopeptidase [Nitzschia inconspicua]
MFGQSTPFGSPPGGGFGQQNTAPSGFGTPAPGGFGSAPAPSAFGAAPAPSGFGGFGSSAPAAPAFGSGGGFGTPAPTFGGGGTTFGSSAPAPTFGAPAPGGFGAPSSSLFGAPAPSTGGIFGTPATTSTGFGGGSSLFGSTPAPASGGFGGGGGFGSAPAPATGGFGSTTGGFGSSSGGFGSTANTTPAFGSSTTTSTFGAPPAPSGGLFGASAPTTSTGFGSTGFGSSTTTSAFGAPAPSPGAFGAPVGGMAGATGTGGTKVTPFQPTQRQDGTSQISLQSITAMQPYENKSFEELRFEDYSQGNKGTGGATQPGSSGGFGTFGAAAPAPTGLFGSSAPAPFGAPAPATSGFGAFGSTSAPAPFGSPAPAPGAFGAPAPGGFGSSTGLFGAKPPATSGLFGASTPAPSGGLFGAPAPSGGLFGASTPAPFGAAAPGPTSAFGAPAPASTSLFGNPAPAPFGAPAPATTSLFGAQSPAPSAFGAPSSGGFGFGSTPAPGGFGAFGSNPAPAPSLFGAPAPGGFGAFGSTTSSAFGAKPPGTPGLFSPTAAPPGGSLFGQPQAPAPAFGAPLPAAMAMPAAPPIGSIIPPAANDILASQLAALEKQKQEWEQKDSFKSQPSPSAAITAATLSERESGSFGPITPGRLSFPTRRSSPSSSAKIRPRGFASPSSDSSSSFMPQSLSKLGNTGKPMPGPESAASFSTTRLIVAPSTQMRLVLGDEEEENDGTSNPSSRSNGVSDIRVGEVLGPAKLNKLADAFSSPKPVSTPINRPDVASPDSARPAASPITRAQEYYNQAIMDAAAPVSHAATPSNVLRVDAAPKLTKNGYTCSPGIETLRGMDPADLATVYNFKVERPGVGKVEWEGAVDVRNADLDNIVVIEPKSVSVYTDEELVGAKPVVGTKLNRPAILTMEGVYPPEGSGPEAIEKFKQKVARQTRKIKAELVEYDPHAGIWKIRVEHFSRYAFDDSDNDDDDEMVIETSQGDQTPLKRKVDFPVGERGVRFAKDTPGAVKKLREDTPYKPRVALVEDEENDLVSDHETNEAGISFEQAAAAYDALQSDLARETALLSQKKKDADDQVCFPEEESLSYVPVDDVKKNRYRPKLDGMTRSITTEIFGTYKNRSRISNFDYSRRMGRSFRVGWGPDGSFVSLGRGGKILRSSPKFDNNAHDEIEAMLKSHRLNCHMVDKSSKWSLLSIAPFAQWIGAEKVLDSYVESTGNTSSTAKMSFDILKVVLDTQKAKSQSRRDDPLLEKRSVFAFTQLFVSSCSSEVYKELKSRGMSLDYKSLLAAISSGDVHFAADMAHRMGFLHLADFLCSSGESREKFVSDTKNLEKIPGDLKKFYTTVAGDVSMGIFRSIGVDFDWKRLLVMQLTYPSAHTNETQDMSSVIHKYEQSVIDAKVPFPTPTYAGITSTPSVESVLFKLLKLEGGRQNDAGNLSYTVDPLGYSRNPHDFSLAFHLASAICSMPYQQRLAMEEEESLIDGFVAQLVSMGLWHWGVYVSLCLICSENATPSLASWRFRQAKTLIYQHFKSDNIAEREALEAFGVPKELFEESISYRALVEGDIGAYIRHLSEADKKGKAREELERTLLPKSLFAEVKKLNQILAITNECSTGGNSLVEVLPELVEVAQKISMLGGLRPDEIKTAATELLSLLDKSEAILLSYQSSERRRLENGPDFYHNEIPLGAFIVKALNDVTHLRLQVMALEEGLISTATTNEMLQLAREKFGPERAANFQRYLL